MSIATFLNDRIEFSGRGGMILKRAIIGMIPAEKWDYGYPEPVNTMTTITIDGGQRFTIHVPTKDVLQWYRGETIGTVAS